MRRILLVASFLTALMASALAQNYTATPGSGLTFGTGLVGGVNYPKFDLCDPTTPANCVVVNASGQLQVVQAGTWTVAATQSGTWAVTQSGAWTVAATQSGTWAVTQSGAWTVAATQSGTWNITNISGTISLPTGAATSALQTTGNTALGTINTTLGSPFQAGGSIGNTTFASTQSGTWTVGPTTASAWGVLAQSSTTSGELGTLDMGAVTTAAPTYVTGNTNPLSLTTAGGLRTDLSGTTVPLPTGAATSALQTTGNTSLASILTALGSPFQAGGSIGNTTFAVTQATAANLNMTCANCSGSGASGTDEGGFTAGASIFAPAGGFFQTTATSNPLTSGQWGAWQMTANRAGFVNLRNASGTEIGTSTTNLIVGQATAANLNATVVGTGTFAVQATQSGTWNIGTITTLPALAAGTNTIGAVIGPTADGTVASTAPILISGTVDGTGTGAVAIPKITAGGVVSTDISTVNAVTTLTGAGAVGTGAQRVAVGQDTTTLAGSAPGTAGTPSANVLSIQGVTSMTPMLANPGTAANWGIGTSTQNSATVANGTLILGQFNTTPTTITTGNMSPFQMDNAGNLLVNIKTGSSSGAVAQGSTTSGQTGSLIQGAVTTAAPAYTTAQTNPLSLTTAGNLRTNDSSLNAAVGTTADAPCTLPATTTTCSEIAVQKAIANAANSAVPLGTLGGWSTVVTSALSTTVTAIKSSAGQIGELYCYNSNASVGYVQIFNVVSGSVTLGTTAPARIYGIPATNAGGIAMSIVGIQFSTAISYAATTTPTGNTALGTGLACNVSFN